MGREEEPGTFQKLKEDQSGWSLERGRGRKVRLGVSSGAGPCRVLVGCTGVFRWKQWKATERF